MQTYHFNTHIERDVETGLYVGMIPNVPGAHTQAATLDELYHNLQEVTSFVWRS